MKTLKEMNMGELKELYIEWRDLYCQHGCEEFRTNALEVEAEYLSRVAETVETVESTTIQVFFEQGYKWTVNITGEDESRVSGVNKADAMAMARDIKKNEFKGKAIIQAQTLSKVERKENMQYLHENTYTFNTNKAI